MRYRVSILVLVASLPSSIDAFAGLTTTSTRTTTQIPHHVPRPSSQPQQQQPSRRHNNDVSLFAGRTLYDKIWDDHLVEDDGMSCLLYVDRHLVHEVTSPQAFEGLRMARRGVRRPDCTLVTVDHNVPTSDRTQFIDVDTFIEETASRTQVLQLEHNVQDFGVPYFSFADERQGIVHIIGPEQGFTVPGCVTVCGDSHTATHGAFGALAFGIGTSEVEHVLATQVRTRNQTIWKTTFKKGKIKTMNGGGGSFGSCFPTSVIPIACEMHMFTSLSCV